jgi:uncharacterized protein (DUF58 family)
LKRSYTPKVGAYAGLAAFGLFASLAAGLPELVALAAPFALAAVLDLVLTERPRLEVVFDVDRERALERDEIRATLTLHAGSSMERLEVLLDLPPGLRSSGARNPIALRLARDELRELEWSIVPERWGAYLLGKIHLRATSRFALVRDEAEVAAAVTLKVYPRAETLQWLVRPHDTQVFFGNQVARQKGEGIEFADLRPFVAGDRVRRINWRASARRDELWVNELHSERNADVVIFLDSFAEARRADGGTLDIAVRAAAGLAHGYLREKDRVGLVSFGGVLNWLLPGSGLVQLYRVVDSLLDTEIILNYAWKDIDILPRRTLPPKALVLALTPLIDERAVGALLDLRARGFDLAIIEVSPVPFAAAGSTEDEQLAYRIWRLRRETLRGRYEEAGVPVTVWSEGEPLVAALEEVRAWRRFAARGRA